MYVYIYIYTQYGTYYIILYIITCAYTESTLAKCGCLLRCGRQSGRLVMPCRQQSRKTQRALLSEQATLLQLPPLPRSGRRQFRCALWFLFDGGSFITFHFRIWPFENIKIFLRSFSIISRDLGIDHGRSNFHVWCWKHFETTQCFDRGKRTRHRGRWSAWSCRSQGRHCHESCVGGMLTWSD